MALRGIAQPIELFHFGLSYFHDGFNGWQDGHMIVRFESIAT